MIHRAKFQNFKALRDVEVTFDSRLTVLVGPNGSGKTSVLQGIHALSQLAIVSGGDRDFQLPKLVDYISIGDPEGILSTCIEGSRPRFGQYSITVDKVQPSRIDGVLTAMGARPPNHWRVNSPYDAGQWHGPQRFEQLLPEDVKRFDLTAFIRFSAGQLSVPTLIRNYPPLVEKDGYGLAATLSHIKSKHPERFDAIIDAFRRVIPNVKGVRFDKERVPETQYYGDILLVDYKGVEGVKASHVSSGTLFALGLLTVALGPDSANVILLDDLDHGLHPKAQMELIEVFRGLTNQNQDLQIIATSHSPYILDKLAWNEVRVTALNDDGSAVCKPLMDHPQYPMWKDSMSPGEFWSHGGEDWVKQLTPQTTAP
jgi:energy-coupling factor transporter ATP-binding protein EcfA2